MSNEYVSPLVERFATKEMAQLWGAQKKFSTWRRCWVALAEAEQELGLPITDEQLAELRAHVDRAVARLRGSVLLRARCGVRPRLQRRDRDGFTPSSLFSRAATSPQAPWLLKRMLTIGIPQSTCHPADCRSMETLRSAADKFSVESRT